jgi:hypothetical protein
MKPVSLNTGSIASDTKFAKASVKQGWSAPTATKPCLGGWWVSFRHFSYWWWPLTVNLGRRGGESMVMHGVRHTWNFHDILFQPSTKTPRLIFNQCLLFFKYYTVGSC